jgi:hypothetical protein
MSNPGPARFHFDISTGSDFHGAMVKSTNQFLVVKTLCSYGHGYEL